MTRTLAALAFGLPVLMAAAPAASPFDALMAAHYKPDAPGAAALVVKDGKTLLRKGYGLASVELGVPVKPEHVFRIGSTTKTFTAVLVMQLVEEGKLALDAPITRYLKDAPKAWEAVTVEHLLTHTSGIPSYTSDPAFRNLVRTDLELDALIATFKDKPLEFEPGTQWAYDNSGYVLLGKLLEVASGKDYEALLKARILDPLGLRHTAYGDERTLIPGMASGYSRGPRPAAYISMTIPHAAGALVSDVDDLAAFTQALHGGKLLKPESLARMTTPYRLKDGKETGYGYGLFIRRSQGRTLIGHGGDIFGFHCQVEADPAAKAVAVILHNGERLSAGGDYLSRRLLALAVGQPLSEPKAVVLAPEQLQRLAGRYGAPGKGRTLRLEDGVLVSRPDGGRITPLTPSSETTFFGEGTELRLRFTLEGGKAVAVQKYEDGGEADPALPRTEDLPDPKAVALAPEAFDPFVGEYEVRPGFRLKVWREGGRFLTQATGQGVFEIFPEGPATFFLKVVPAKLAFRRDEAGAVTGAVLMQNGREIPARKVK